MIFSLENCTLKWHTYVKMTGLWGYVKKINVGFQDLLYYKKNYLI